MATIARIIVTENNLQNKQQLFRNFITESKIELKGEKHQFVLLPAGFLTFDTTDLTGIPLSEPQEKVAKQEWNTKIENLKEQAFAEFRKTFDFETLKELSSVADYLVIGIDSNVAPKSKDIRIQFV